MRKCVTHVVFAALLMVAPAVAQNPPAVPPAAPQDGRQGPRPEPTGIYAYRDKALKALTGMLIFGDNPSGELFYLDADKLPKGGQNFHRILFNDKGEAKTLLQLIKKKTFNRASRRRSAPTSASASAPTGNSSC